MTNIARIQQYLPSSYLPEKWKRINVRSIVRFMVLGLIGTAVQTGFFMLAMKGLHQPEKGTLLYYVAFGIGFFLEMIPNYFFTNWYTFGTNPTLKNAGGFVLARATNLVAQFALLPLLVYCLPQADDGLLSFVCIFLAGIVNFLILLIFFSKKK